MEMKTFDTKIQLPIGGMTCVNCQNKIEKKLKETNGIIHASVNYRNGVADIVYDESQISKSQIAAVIEHLGYKVLLQQEHPETDNMKTICMLVIIISLYMMLQWTGFLNRLVPSQLSDTTMGYGMIFVIGLITSVHCIAMCGGINLSQCIPRTGNRDTENMGRRDTFYPALAYNLGRVLSYTVVGLVLGMIGFLIGGDAVGGESTLLQGILKIIAGLFMVIMGINMLGIFPWLRKYTISMPRFFARKIGQEKTRSHRPFYVGVLNGFMPCGPLQSMWIVALATASPFAGALSMLLFSLGTVPLMLGLGSLVSALGKKFTDEVMTVGAVLVVVLGLAMLSQGGSLSGWFSSELLLLFVIVFSLLGVLLSLPAEKQIGRNVLVAVILVAMIGFRILHGVRGIWSSGGDASDIGVKGHDGVQVVNSTLEAGHYPNISVQSGIPVKWVINAPEGSVNGCNYKLIIQDYDLEYTFQTGENVIEFTPTEAGTIRYSCWMGMIHGNITVTDGSEGEIPS